MEEEHIHDPLRFQYASSTRTFSLRTKIMAVVLVLIFCSIPLYELSPDAFKVNHIEVPCGCAQTLSHGCFHFIP